MRIEGVLRPRFAWLYFLGSLTFFLFGMGVTILSVRADHEAARLRDEIRVQQKQEKNLELEQSMLTRESRIRTFAQEHNLNRAAPASVIYLP